MSNPLEEILLDEAGADPRPESDRGEGARRDGRMRLLPEPVRRLLQRKAVKNAGILTGGTMLAQVVTLASTPLLSRLYGPEQFGLLGLLMNIATMGGSVGALCYEMAILQPRSERTARALFALSIQLSFLASLIVMAIIWALDSWRHGVFGRPLDLWFYVFCYVGVLTSVQLNALSLAQSRRDLFRPMAISKINQTLLPTVFQIAFGFLKNVDLGLMAGRTIGLIGTNIVMQRAQPAGYRMRDAFRTPWRELRVVARRYKDYMFHVPRQLLMRGATTAPPILLDRQLRADRGGPVLLRAADRGAAGDAPGRHADAAADAAVLQPRGQEEAADALGAGLQPGVRGAGDRGLPAPGADRAAGGAGAVRTPLGPRGRLCGGAGLLGGDPALDAADGDAGGGAAHPAVEPDHRHRVLRAPLGHPVDGAPRLYGDPGGGGCSAC